jgi:hypothetical protein
VPPGIADATVPNPVFNLTPAATVDEGNNWINISWGPLAMANPVTGTVLGNYALTAASPAINYITPTNSATTYAAAPSLDFFGTSRKTNSAVDVGAVEFQAAAAPGGGGGGGGGTASVTLSAPVPALTTTPVNTTTKNGTVTVTNAATATGAFTFTAAPAVTKVGNPNTGGTFSIATGGTCTSSTVLNPGGTCTINVQYAPGTSTATATAHVTVTGTGGSAPTYTSSNFNAN